VLRVTRAHRRSLFGCGARSLRTVFVGVNALSSMKALSTKKYFRDAARFASAEKYFAMKALSACF